MSVERLRIATRKSPLALWQAEYVKTRLEVLHKGLQVDLVPIRTQGDRILDSPLSKVGGKGLFVKELEVGILEGRADIAVHSMKDVPAQFPEGLGLMVILDREDPMDAFVSNKYPHIDELPQGAVLGTSSLRRHCQISAWRSDIQIKVLRGNVNTRLSKLDAGEYDAIILAAAGLRRLGMDDRIGHCIDIDLSLPAVGQGAIGIEGRLDDEATLSLIQPLNDAETAIRVKTERALSAKMMGGCQAPIAGFAVVNKGQICLHGLVGRLDGSEIIRGSISGEMADAERLGEQLADDLLSRGAREILAQLSQG